ncbi:DNA polymerase I [Anaerofilum sp. BX8]|uniref:DNA polymerase I n=1 Tax=Anaerofilum hominis TaxID=2763016 RepID=A0A923I9B3_9FIRM|nr:DNA polymerase I [Anaerofilum hominis]MBC5581292.1 DNA polymerase I [Anaerofilum hominis]
MKLLAIDGNSIVNRAFYGIKLLTTKDGRYTNGLVGFMNILLKLLADEKPDGVAVAFDLPKPTFRHKRYDNYKGTRKGMPEELAQQMPLLKELLTDLGYKIVTAEGFEADDILGTLAADCAADGDECVIATGDRDSLQLVAPGTRVLLASTQMGRSVTVNMDEAAVREKYGVEPRQLIEVKALMGDASDNIPGVAGVGEKTALALIAEFGSLAGVYEHLDSPSIKPGVRAKLERDKEQAEMSRFLAEIVTDAPVPHDVADYRPGPGNPAAAARLLASLEMVSLLDKLGLQQSAAAAPPPTAQTDAPAPARVEALPLPAGLKGPVAIAAAGDGYSIVRGGELYAAKAGDPAFLALLADEKTEKRVFDAKPLYTLMLSHGKRARGIVFDGKLAAYLLNPSASGYDPVRLAAEYGVQPAFVCGDDAAGVLEPLFDVLAAACEEQGMTRLLGEIELPLSEVLSSMEVTGILVDRAGIEQFGVELRQVLQAELAEIYELVGYEFNLNSTKQLGDALFGKLGLPARKKTKSGWSTNAETLESLRGMHPVVEHILLYRTYQKLNSTYVEGLLKVIGPDGRIHSAFSQTETRTGRISSSEPNLQNIPVRTELGSRLRKYFIAPQGRVLLDADYSQIELRILAAISGDEHMQAAFGAGEDIHRATASRIFGVPFELVTPQLRSRAKAVNFGIVYGIGAFSLAKDVGVSVKEADTFIKNYLSEYSGVKHYMEKTVEDGREKGYVATLYGRRRPLPELTAANRNIRALGERMAMNTPIQGTAADVIKLAMIRVFQRLEAEGLTARLVLQVHDELIVEAPEEEADRAAKILGEEMERAADLAVKLTAEVNRGRTWYEAKG